MSELILCGRGGQGIVFLTRLIGEIVTAKGLDVISSETHGMAVRGGSINSHLRIGPFSSSLIRLGRADFLVSLDASETANNRHYLRPDGQIVENSTLPDEPGIRRCDAASLRTKFGAHTTRERGAAWIFFYGGRISRIRRGNPRHAQQRSSRKSPQHEFGSPGAGY